VRDELSEEQAAPKCQALKFDNLTIDLTRREVLLDNTPLSLKPQEYALLLFLARHRGQALSR
jgi:DNA-binding response OmpR family regulator